MSINIIICLYTTLLLLLAIINIFLDCKKKIKLLTIVIILITIVVTYFYIKSPIANNDIIIRLDGTVIIKNNYISLLSYL